MRLAIKPSYSIQGPSLGRIKLQDLTCPLIRLDEARRKDKSMGFFVSVILHTVIFAVAGISLIKQPEFGIDRGESGVDVELVAAAEPAPAQAAVEPLPVEEIKSDIVEKVTEPVIQAQPSVLKQEGKDQMTVRSSGGAISEAKPDYLKNPAPEYPQAARRRRQEGVVILTAFIDKSGNALKVIIEKSSGHRLLDEAALNAVRKWRFRPGQLGNIPVESTVRVPVRFDLKDA